MNAVSTENENASSSMNVTNKRKRVHDTSLKLWHCRLGHISRGRIERLIKKSIHPPLEFLVLEHCIDCIKGKYVKKIMKDAKRNAGILETVHIDICGPFPMKSVDGYDSFVTFTDDILVLAIFIQLRKDRRRWINLRYLRLK